MNVGSRYRLRLALVLLASFWAQAGGVAQGRFNRTIGFDMALVDG